MKKRNQADEWKITRRKWIKKNPADFQGYWYCVVGGGALTKDTLTLDHNISRSRDPSLRHDLTNLFPMCGKHNFLKGSRSLKEYNDSKPDLKCY
jgi:5-methylcytosine-specific restriction endonuclease McrA